MINIYCVVILHFSLSFCFLLPQNFSYFSDFGQLVDEGRFGCNFDFKIMQGVLVYCTVGNFHGG